MQNTYLCAPVLYQNPQDAMRRVHTSLFYHGGQNKHFNSILILIFNQHTKSQAPHLPTLREKAAKLRAICRVKARFAQGLDFAVF